MSRHDELTNSVRPTLHLLGAMVAFLSDSSIMVETVFSMLSLGRLKVGPLICLDHRDGFLSIHSPR